MRKTQKKSQKKEIEDLGGGRLLLIHDSVSQLFSTLYPDFEWLPWLFGKVPKNYWGDVNNQLKFLNWAGKKLNINKMEDWYNVSYKVDYCEVLKK